MNTVIQGFVEHQNAVIEKYLTIESFLVELTITALEEYNIEDARIYTTMLKMIKEIQHKIIALLLLTEKYSTTVEEQKAKIDEIIEKILQ